MIIKTIKLKNFKNFEKANFSFSSLTFIKGANGSGKTTLALDSLLYGLFGYYRGELLGDLVTRGKAKKASVEVILEHNNKVYEVIRAYPTKISIKEGDTYLKFVNSTDAQNWINKTFGDRLNFCRFRLIDTATQDTNFLEAGQTTIKKILFSATDEIFNNLKKKLNNIKSNRERFCKDKAVTYTHYPSEKRLLLISSKLKEFGEHYREMDKEVNSTEKEQRILELNISKNEYRQSEITRTIVDLQTQMKNLKIKSDIVIKKKTCFVCKQTLPESSAKRIVQDKTKEIAEKQTQVELLTKESNELLHQVPILKEELKNIEEIIIQDKYVRDTFLPKKDKLNNLKMKLETRIKQKDFKYTPKQVEIVKKAITEVDGLSTYYLIETIKILEPIINSVLEKIHFNVKFETNEKGKFEIQLTKEGVIYKYKDLSTGQKLLLQIAFKLAILLERNSSGIIIADEGMSSLDEENLNHILQIFENYPFQLLLVLHRFNEVPDNIQVIDLSKRKENEKIKP